MHLTRMKLLEIEKPYTYIFVFLETFIMIKYAV